jgi:hypothetical protein
MEAYWEASGYDDDVLLDLCHGDGYPCGLTLRRPVHGDVRVGD